MKPELADREPIAFHELGHAAAFWFFGYKVSSVEVGEDFGCTELPPKQIVNGFHYIVSMCAGKAAVDRWYGWKSASEKNWLASQDQRRAFKVALQLSGGDPLCAGMLMAWAEKRAEILVEDQWPQLSKAALALVQHGKLEVAA